MIAPLSAALIYGVPGFLLGMLVEWLILAEEPMTKIRERFSKCAPMQIIGVLVVLACVASSILVARGQGELRQCQVASWDRTITQLNDTRTLADQDRIVVDDLVDAIVHAKTQKEVLVALNTYQQARAENDKTRAEQSPYPSIGDCD